MSRRDWVPAKTATTDALYRTLKVTMQFTVPVDQPAPVFVQKLMRDLRDLGYTGPRVLKVIEIAPWLDPNEPELPI